MLISPVADYNLAEYLNDTAQVQQRRGSIPDFFGCLSRGLWYLHRNSLRHRDIKPQNILVFNHTVLLTDFDCSYDWSHTIHSTTAAAPPMTPPYASPEVARAGRQNTNRIKSSSDVWSLGCVFLEIMTVWKGVPPEQLATLRDAYYYESIEGIRQLTHKLRGILTQPSLDQVIDLIDAMLQYDPVSRPTAQRLAEMTTELCCIDCRGEDSGISPFDG
jgi:serine/threonine protein kinase